MIRATINAQRPQALLVPFAILVLLAGFLALAVVKPAWATLGFVSHPNIGVGDAPTTVASADFDKDGNTDLATSNYASDGVSVVLGDGAGGFEEVTGGPVSAGDAPTSVTRADLDGDANADLAVSNEASNDVSVLLGNGDGTFRDKPDLAVGTSPTSVVSADFDGDGDADLAVSNSASGNVSVMLGNGDGTFQTAQHYSVSVGGIRPNQIITDDFDGNGDVDLATANVGQNTEIANFHGGVTVLLGNGDGTFQDARRVAREFLNYSVASADFDNDGDSDLVATSYGMTGGCCIYGEVTVALGNGDGTFGAARFFRVGSGHTGPSAVTSADFDRDGDADLAISNSATDDVSVMLGNGDGTFGTAQNFPAGDLPAFVINPDLDADGVADLAVANQNSNNVSVLLNTTPPPPPETIPPTTNHRVSPLPNAAGWNNSNVTVTLNATDTGGSGVKEITYSASGAQTIPSTTVPGRSAAINITTEGTTTISYFSTDNATNEEEPNTVTVKVDKTAPQITPGDRVDNIWRNSSLSEQFTASDGGSGLANSADASFTLTASAESASATQPTVVSRTVSDVAGNPTTRKVSALIDLGRPQTAASLTPRPNANGWNDSDVTIALNATDAGGSGLKVIRYSATGAQNIAETDYDPQNQPVISTEGTTTIRYFATDSAGNQESPAKTFTIRLDKSAPTIGGVSPTDAATGIPHTANVEATFLEDMDLASITDQSFTLTKQGSSSPVAAQVGYEGANKKATLNPASNLAPNTTYTAAIKGGSNGARDLAGNALAQDHSWTFTTAASPDNTAPRVTGATPTGTGVRRGADVSATFSEKMAPASISKSTFKLFKCASTTSSTCTTQVTNVTVTLSEDGLRATLNPYGTSSTLLATRTKYKAVVTTGAKDLAGFALDQNTTTSGNQPKTWTFTTGSS